MTELPASFYAMLGFIIFTQLTAIGTMIALVFKGGLFVAETRSGIKDAKDAAIRAHKRIDRFEE